MPIRNGVLCRANSAAAGAVSIGAVPPTDTWLVKDIHVYNSAAVQQTVIVYASRADELILVPLFNQTMVAAAFGSWSGLIALGPGDFILVNSGAAGAIVWVSGADLPGHL